MTRRRHLPPRLLLAPLLAALCLAAGCSGLSLLNTVTPNAGYERRNGIAYGTEERQELDVYRPRELAGEAPVVVFFYGGSWMRGQRERYEFMGRALTGMGAVAVIPDYRLYPEVTFPAFAEDAARATAWTLENAEELGGDPDRIYLMGHSAGAHLAALVATDASLLERHGHAPGRLAGLIGISGAYDFLRKLDDPLPLVFPEPGREASQPVRFVDGDEPPVLLLHGTGDFRVWPYNTESFALALEAAGVEVEVRYFDDVGHGRILAGLVPSPLRLVGPDIEEPIRALLAAGASDRGARREREPAAGASAGSD